MTAGSPVRTAESVSSYRRARSLLTRPGLARNAVVLAGGTMIGQLVSVCALPAVTRLYSPADMGYYGLLLSYFSLAGVAASLKYETAIMTPIVPVDGLRLTLIAALVSVPMSLLLSGALAGMIATRSMGYGILAFSVIPWTFAALMLTAVFSSLRYFLLRHERYASITKVTIYQNAARVVTQIGVGLASGGWLGLIAGEVAGRAAGMRLMLRPYAKELTQGLRDLTFADVVTTLKRYRRFPLFTLPSSLVDTSAVALVLPLLARYHGAEAAGFFALAQRVLGLPATLIGQSVADAFHARLSVTVRTAPHDTRRLFMQTALLLFAVSAPPTLLFLFVGKPVFALVFGERWRTAGAIAVAMAPWMLAQIVVSPLSRAVFVLSGQATKLIYDACSLGLMLAVLILASRAGLDIVETIWWLSGARVTSYAVYFFVLRHIVSHATDMVFD